MQIYTLSLKLYAFSEQGDQTPVKTDGPCDPEFQNTSATVSLTFFIQRSFKAAGWDCPDSQTSPAGTSLLSQFSQGFPKDNSTHKQLETV